MSAAISGHADVGQRVSGGRAGEPMTLQRVLRQFGPVRLKGDVVQGFKRGSRELGWPTANLDPAAFESTLDESEEGVYVGWASVDDETLPPEAQRVHKAVLSIGWNPFYKNKKRTVEAYLCHDFGERDFYGQPMRLLICAFLRPQADFDSMESLIDAITADIDFGKEALDKADLAALRTDQLFAR